MNLHYGKIVDIFDDDGLLTGRISVGGALKKVPLQLVTEVRPGDHVLVCDGVAISRVNDELSLEDSYVSGHTW
jgi:hydrogenase maturation factor